MKSSFAVLTHSNMSYVQVAGGPTLFLLEYRDVNGQIYRAFQNNPVVPFPDGTTIESSAGRIVLQRAEWFLYGQILEVLSIFLDGELWPSYVNWRTLDEVI